ncbi:MAG: hypothetical protein M0C28_34655 [Candidatus Moduliflexus flocculans]|nr:hypothetical protein [Candidatus Moduliflexus flocculans]
MKNMKKLSLSLHTTFFPLLSACGEATVTPDTATEAEAGERPRADRLHRRSMQPVEARVEDLLKRMTLDEKIGQMTPGGKEQHQARRHHRSTTSGPS